MTPPTSGPILMSGAMVRPEPCLSGRCWSPISCGDWGYCRERNMPLKGAPSPEQQRAFRKEAAERAASHIDQFEARKDAQR